MDHYFYGLLWPALTWFTAYLALGRCQALASGGPALRAFQAAPLGWGAGTLLLYVWLQSADRISGFPLAAGSLTLLGGWLLAILPGNANSLAPARVADLSPAAPPQSQPLCPRASPPIWLWLGVGLLALAALAAMVCLAFTQPHGEWDAWKFWNYRARFLYLAGTEWRAAFALPSAHPDYPLYLPGLVAGTWAFAREADPRLPMTLSLLTAWLTVGLIYSGVRRRDEISALLAVTALLTTEFFIKHGAGQMADLPLGCQLLAAWVALNLAQKAPEETAAAEAAQPAERSWLFLGGCFLGLTAWTKNEGLMLLPAALAAWVVAGLWRGRSRSKLSGEIGWMLAGAAAPLAAVIHFKLNLAPPNDLLAGGADGKAFARLLDPGRYILILRAYAENLLRLGHLPLLLALVLLWRKPRRTPWPPALSAGFIFLTLALAGYFLIYLNTFYELEWHLRTSLRRLLLQLWPTFIYLTALAVAPARHWFGPAEFPPPCPEPAKS